MDDAEQALDTGTTQEQLELEYTQLGWKEYGFSFNAFLRWRAIKGDFGLSAFRNYRSLYMSDLEGKTIDDKILVDLGCPDAIIKDEISSLWSKFQLRMVRPEWADVWAEKFYDPKEAVPWAMLGMGLDDANAIQAIRFRKPGRAVIPFAAMRGQKGLLEAIKKIGPEKFAEFPKSGYDISQVPGIQTLLNMCVMEVAPLGEEHIESFLTNAPRATRYRHMLKREEINPDYNDEMTHYALLVRGALNHIASKGVDPPDIQTFRLICFRAGSRYDYDSDYAESLLCTMIDQVDNIDQLQDISNLIETTSRVFWMKNGVTYQWSRDAIAWCAYSAKTGVPLEWLEKDIIDQFLAGSLEGDVIWVNRMDGTGHRSPTVDDLSEMVTSQYGS